MKDPGKKRNSTEVGFHSLRHTFVSLAANAGAPFALVQSIVGQSTAEMTRHYFHENDDALKTTVDTLPDVTRLSPAGLLPAPAQINAPISTAKIFAAINVLPESDLRTIREAIDKRLAITIYPVIQRRQFSFRKRPLFRTYSMIGTEKSNSPR